MRGSRAKSIRKYAAQNPSKLKSQFYGRTLVHGGATRTYRELKRQWRMKGMKGL